MPKKSPGKKPIPVTNDNGIAAPVIRALDRQMRALEDVYVVAPDAEQVVQRLKSGG